MTNEELLQKAITAAEALATHGKLQPAQADKFLDYVINESVMKNNVRVVRFRNEKLEIDKIGINKRFGNRRPAFDQHPRDAANSQSLQSTFRTDHTLVVERNREDLRRFRAQ